jgi:antiviral helicase SKI2
MSGRAGRRGLDSIGHVFLCFPPEDPLPLETEVRNVLTGPVLTLKSAFRLTYNMILNILRVDELRVEDMMQKSFSEAAGELKAESINELVAKADEQMALMDQWAGGDAAVDGEIRRYVAMLVRLKELTSELLPKLVMSGPSFNEAFANGRVVIVWYDEHVLRLAVVIRKEAASVRPRTMDRVRVVVLVGNVDANVLNSNLSAESILIDPLRRQAIRSAHYPEQFVVDGLHFQVEEVPVTNVVWFSETILPGAPKAGPAVTTRDPSRALKPAPFLAVATQLGRYACHALQTLVAGEASASADEYSVAPCQALARIAGARGAEETLARWEERHSIVTELAFKAPSAGHFASALWSLPSGRNQRSRILKGYALREKLRAQIQTLRTSASVRRIPDLMPEYRKRVKVLQKMQYVGEDGVSVLIKGRYGACEVATVDSVLLTEIVLENVLNGLAPAEIASLLSALVCRKKNPASATASGVAGAGGANLYSEAYNEAKASMRTIVRNFGAVQQEAGVELDFEIADAAEDYEGAICRWSLAEVVLKWAQGAPFAEVVTLTDLQEGDVVVTVKRLVELLKDAKGVAKAVGNEDLEVSIEEAIEAIRRDIIFSGSLYLT